MGNVEAYYGKAIELLMSYGPKLLLAIIVLLIGLWLIKILVKFIRKALEKAGTDVSLKNFFLNLINILLKALLLISVASMIGIATTSFVAILAAAGLAIGMALSGNLSNFAGGVLILFLKPFKVGDFINAQGHAGTVHEIQIFHTILKTPDNKTIIIPNGILSNGSIINFSTESQRRVDLTFGIGYKDDLKQAREVLQKAVTSDNKVLTDPAPTILVSQLGSNAVNFEVRAWCKTDDYWDVYFKMHENVKLAFDKAGVSIPFAQQDIHVYQHKAFKVLQADSE